MILLPLYAASVIGAFIGWYACGPIKNRNIRCIVRASLVAFFVLLAIVCWWALTTRFETPD